jgi:hypothetical protein
VVADSDLESASRIAAVMKQAREELNVSFEVLHAERGDAPGAGKKLRRDRDGKGVANA